MIDIDFYMKVFDFKRQLMDGQIMNKQSAFNKLESYRSKEPVIYNIETTNACNMRCEMCPRTTMMTRPIKTVEMDTFKRIIGQIRPFSEKKWEKWEIFVQQKYGIAKQDMGENHFFLYVIPKVLVLHGYGDPLLDKKMSQRIKLLTMKKIPSYFSCNPVNIDIAITEEMLSNGLDYIKYSIESVNDTTHKQIRGKVSDFTGSFKKIRYLVSQKKKYGYKTVIVITMLDLARSGQNREFNQLKRAFAGMDVYIYLKSQDQKWYQAKQFSTNSIHWREFCQFPWSSMTIKSNGEAVECVEDFNNQIILGDVFKDSLYNIWNGEKYRRFRQDHFNLTPGIKCTEQCDMRLAGSFIKG